MCKGGIALHCRQIYCTNTTFRVAFSVSAVDSPAAVGRFAAFAVVVAVSAAVVSAVAAVVSAAVVAAVFAAVESG